MSNKLKRSLDKNFSYSEYNPKNKIQNKNDAQKQIHYGSISYENNSNDEFWYQYLNSDEDYQEFFDENIIIEKEKINIEREINGLQDLLNIIEDYPYDENKIYNIDLEKLHSIKVPLFKLNSLIGLQELKTNISDQIIYYLQNLHIPKKENKINEDYLHTVLYGPPGTGKTEIAMILGDIFCKMDILKSNKFRKVTRSDLIAGYLGQTALKTRDVIKDSLGGVLFIDEAYSLGNAEKRDSFAKECLDTLCESLSNHKNELMVIIAGYEEELNNCFFSFNPGLRSRFTWNYKINEYSCEELKDIFIKKVNDNGWTISDEIKCKFFEDNKLLFKSFGRDIENFFSKIKIAHSRRVFCLEDGEKTKITFRDIEKGLELFKNNSDDKEKDDNKIIALMYT
jgi:SpoVK/Ycf46/Vps4 family AAA+-type ATPase